MKYFRPYLYGRAFDLETDHQALKWIHTKYIGKDLNPRLQRWILSLGEYNINIDYLKGKDNKIADFLSRINTDTNEINNIDEINKEQNNIDNESLQPTIHSQEEEQNDKFTILESIVNRFKIQIIFSDNFTTEFENILGNRRIYINPTLNKNELIIKLKSYISNIRIGIYTQISDSHFYKIQKILVEEFPNNIF